MIITGLRESENDEADIEDVFRSVVPDLDLDTSSDYKSRRLGNRETARLPRPLLVEFTNKAYNKKKKIKENGKRLKGKDKFDKVYIKSDIHPIFSKEHSRLNTLVWEEKKRPENGGCNILYDRKKGVVTKDDIVIDRFLIHV